MQLSRWVESFIILSYFCLPLLSTIMCINRSLFIGIQEESHLILQVHSTLCNVITARGLCETNDNGNIIDFA